MKKIRIITLLSSLVLLAACDASSGIAPTFAKEGEETTYENFMNQYFHVVDADLLLENFDKMENTDLMPYWPFKSYDPNKKVVFSAVNAYIVKATDDQNARQAKPYNFNIYEGDTFDLNNKEDLEKSEVIKSLLDAIVILYTAGAAL